MFVQWHLLDPEILMTDFYCHQIVSMKMLALAPNLRQMLNSVLKAWVKETKIEIFYRKIEFFNAWFFM